MPVRNVFDGGMAEAREKLIAMLNKQQEVADPGRETPELPKLGWYRHYKSGAPYEVVGFCRIESTLGIGVLYSNEDCRGTPWMRPLEDFNAAVEIGPRMVTSRFTYDEALTQANGVGPELVQS